MRVVGLDLAGSPRNETGYCVLDVGDVKAVTTRVLHSDDEILYELKSDRPKLTAVDAPLKYDGGKRSCDEMLREYGALPVTLKGMTVLAERGRGLASKLHAEGLECIEVYSTATAKILGLYSKNDFTLQKNMMALDLTGELTSKILSRDELDAVLAAVTAYLHLIGQTKSVGDDAGEIIIPEI
jgi:predicted nuclease with RNAse H fold